MANINRLIAQGTGTNLAVPFIGGMSARQQFTSRDLANTTAQNQLDKQANVNRLLQQQGQALLGGQPTAQALPQDIGQVSPQATTGAQTPNFASLLTEQDKQQVQLLMANQDIKGMNDFRQEVLSRGEKTSELASKQESGLRKEFDKASGEFIKVRDAHTRVLKAAEDPSGAGDLALIFNFMKVLDPGSTVREGEFATAQSAAGVDGRIIALYNQVVKGTRLSPPQRADFVNRSGRLFEGAVGNQSENRSRFEGIAKRGGLDPQNVVFEFKLPAGKTKKKVAEITTNDFETMDLDDLRDFVNNHPDAR